MISNLVLTMALLSATIAFLIGMLIKLVDWLGAFNDE